MVKTTGLTECPKCHKMIMNKTLKYSHSKTCGIVKGAISISTPRVILTPAIKHVKSVSAITPPKVVYNAPTIAPITLDEMRRQYYNNAKQQRIQRMQSLFSTAI